MRILLPVMAAVMSWGCMDALETLFGSQLEYDYLYECLWIATDVTDEADELPANFADEETALYFDNSRNMLLVLHKKDNATLSSGKDVYYVTARYSYSIDTSTGMLSVTGDTADCYFSVERLNDRVLTMCYSGNRNIYVAYSRTDISSVAIL